MLVVIGPGGGINWGTTQTMLRHNWQAFLQIRNSDTGGSPHPERFGSVHLWETFRCGGRCDGRILPIDIADVDHISPKSLFTWNFVTHQKNSFETVNGASWKIKEEGHIEAIDYSNLRRTMLLYVKKDNNTITIQLGPNKTKEYSVKKILTNNVSNLQLLCPPCNRSKGAVVD